MAEKKRYFTTLRFGRLKAINLEQLDELLESLKAY